MADNPQESSRDRIFKLRRELRWRDGLILLAGILAALLFIVVYVKALEQFFNIRIEEHRWWHSVPILLVALAISSICLSYIRRRNIREDQESKAVESDEASD